MHSVNFKYSQYRKFGTEFIEVYKQQKYLWENTTAKKDPQLLKQCYEKLVKKMKEVDKKADIVYVQRKLHSLRSNYFHEVKEIAKFKKRGQKHVPRLWYFKLLSFLSSKPKKQMPTVELTPIKMSVERVAVTSTPTKQIQQPVTPKKSEKKNNFNDNNIISEKKNKVSQIIDLDSYGYSCDIVGKNIANKLKRVNPEMRIFAEKLLHDVLFEAGLGILNRSAHICTYSRRTLFNAPFRCTENGCASES